MPYIHACKLQKNNIEIYKLRKIALHKYKSVNYFPICVYYGALSPFDSQTQWWEEGENKQKTQSGWQKKSPESLTAWSTQVADSQETDLIMLRVTMLCPYSGWHPCWQRPPLHSNQETKCRGAPQSSVGKSLGNHLPGSRESNRKYSPDMQYNAIRQTELAFYPGD